MRLRLVPREDPGRWSGLRVAAGALLISALAGAGLFTLAGAPPGQALLVLVREPVSSTLGRSETLLAAIPLILCGLAVATAYQVGLWNIGAEGQLYMGAFAAAGVALYIDIPPGTSLVAMALAGAVAGALWAALATSLAMLARVSEILGTLMLNYVAIAWVELLVFGPWKGKDGFPYTEYIADHWQLPLLYRRVHAGLLVAVGAGVLLYWLLKRTTLGYEVRVIGASPQTARYAGIPIARRRMMLMALAGAMAGLAGAFEVSGVAHRLHASISPGYGYTAIIVAFLARNHLLAVVPVAIGFAALAVGAEGVQIEYSQIPPASVYALQGLLLTSVLVGQGLVRYRLRIERAPQPGSPSTGEAS